jgi:hypothetical protein
MTEPKYLQIRNWDRFQYRADKPLPWIKTYDAQLTDPDYLALTAAERGFLHDLRLLANKRGNKVLNDPSYIRRALGHGASTHRALIKLLASGFVEAHESCIEIPANIVDLGAPRTHDGRTGGALDREGERDKDKTSLGERVDGPLADNVRSIFQPIVRKRDGTMPYTGCRVTKGTNGVGYVRDILGVDRPPADWKHEFPSAAEVARELERRRAA